MARKTPTAQNLDSDVARELERALDLDLASDMAGDLEVATSMEDLEAQISQAADELARESRSDDKTAEADSNEPSPAPVEAKSEHETVHMPMGLRPADDPMAPPPASTFSPANDDRQRDFRAALSNINRRSSRGLTLTVALISIAWIAGGAMLAHLLFGPGVWDIRSAQALPARPYLILLAVGVIVPVLLLWAVSALMRRAQEMRLAAQSMTELALRFAEPESMAKDRVMMVGQAVRREVAAMGEGIERTLARAVELETLVHTEVNELERAYSQNEMRIRTLVDGLGSERDALISHAERVRSSISGAHETLREELGSASDMIRDSVLAASTKLSTTITGSGDTLIERINDSGASISGSIDQRLDAISDRITTSGGAFASLLDTRIASLTQSTDDVTRSLSQMLDERTTGMVSLLGDTTENLNAELETRLKSIEQTLAARGQSLIGEFQARADALDTGTQKLNAALEARARQINETLVERAREIANTFTDGKQDLSAMIDEGKAKIGAEMAEIVMSTSTMLEARASEFAGNLEASRHLIGHAFDADIAKLAEARAGVDAAVEAHVRQFGDSRDRMAAALQDDLRKFADDRAEIGLAIEGISRNLPKAAIFCPARLTTICARSPSIVQPSTQNSVCNSSGWTPAAIRSHALSMTIFRGSGRPAARSMKRSQHMSPSSPKAATSSAARSRRTCRSSTRAAQASTTSSPDKSRNLPRVATFCPGRLEEDLNKLNESRTGIDNIVAGQVEKLAQGRDILARSLEGDLQKLSETRAAIDETVAGHVGKLAEGRTMLTEALATTSAG